MKHKRLFNLIAGIALVAFSTNCFTASDKLDNKLKAKANGGGNETVSVIVQYHAIPDVLDIDAALSTRPVL